MPDASLERIGPTLDVYSDYVCPFSRLVWPVVQRVRMTTPVRLRLRAFELRPVPAPFADDGYVHALWMHAQPIADRLAIPIAFPAVRTRTRKAHEAVAYARTQGRGEEMHEAVLRAGIEASQDIGRIDVLVRIGTEVGLDPSGLKVALDIDRFTDEVLDDCARAAELGIRAVPAFVLHGATGEDAIRTGWQEAESLLNWLRANLMAERK